jgi:hypothetical protein
MVRWVAATAGSGSMASVVAVVGWPAVMLLAGLGGGVLVLLAWVLADEGRSARFAILLGHGGAHRSLPTEPDPDEARLSPVL